MPPVQGSGEKALAGTGAFLQRPEPHKAWPSQVQQRGHPHGFAVPEQMGRETQQSTSLSIHEAGEPLSQPSSTL